MENSLALLKGKFRKLKFIDVTNLKYIPNIIATAVVFHNFIIDAEGDFVESDSDEGNDEREDIDVFEGMTAREIRDFVANSL